MKKLSNLITKFLSFKRLKMKNKWQRVLPVSELLVDRWEKAEFLGFGEGTNVYDSCYIIGDVKVGKNCWIGPFTFLDGSGGLEIGDYCAIGTSSKIMTHWSGEKYLTAGQAESTYNKTTIGDCTVVTTDVVISLGVTIGKHCLVAANSFVKDSFEDYSIIAGTPAKKVGTIEIIDNKVAYHYFKK